MLPDLTNVRERKGEGERGRTIGFTVSYLYSTFRPYDSVLFSIDLRAEAAPELCREQQGR